jgi:hypothetical protein
MILANQSQLASFDKWNSTSLRVEYWYVLNPEL